MAEKTRREFIRSMSAALAVAGVSPMMVSSVAFAGGEKGKKAAFSPNIPEIYKKLAQRLDTRGVGFPETKSGVEYKLLKWLFTEAPSGRERRKNALICEGWMRDRAGYMSSMVANQKSEFAMPVTARLSKKFYDNVYDVLVNRGKLVVTPAQVRRQIAVIEECHKQNRLPKRR